MTGIGKDIFMCSKTVGLEFLYNLEAQEHIDFEKGVEAALWRICRMKISNKYQKYMVEPDFFEKKQIIDNLYLCGMTKTSESVNSKYVFYRFRRIHPENNIKFVLATSIRRYFLRRDLLLEKRENNRLEKIIVSSRD